MRLRGLWRLRNAAGLQRDDRAVTSCAQIKEELSDCIDGELPWTRRLAVKMHLWLCEGCRREHEELARTVGLLKKCKKRGSHAD